MGRFPGGRAALATALFALGCLAIGVVSCGKKAGAPAQAGMTVEDVIKLVKAGLAEDIVVQQIRKNNKAFDLSTDQLLQLKSASVSDRIVQAMLDPSRAEAGPPPVASQAAVPPEPASPPVAPEAAAPGPATARAVPSKAAPKPAPAPAPSKAAAAPAPATPQAGHELPAAPAAAPPPAPSKAPAAEGSLPADAGVYAGKSGRWVELNPEIVNWKTSGVARTIATAGIIKGNVNGHVAGRSSPNAAAKPHEFLIVAIEGAAATEYQLVRLHVNKDNREFRSVTGGVLHSQSGAARDMVPFEWAKVGLRAFRVTTNLEPGEYGFLPPGSTGASGKIYSFRAN